jgi:hypothetical protein
MHSFQSVLDIFNNFVNPYYKDYFFRSPDHGGNAVSAPSILMISPSMVIALECDEYISEECFTHHSLLSFSSGQNPFSSSLKGSKTHFAGAY